MKKIYSYQSNSNRRKLLFALSITLFVMIAEVVGGFISNSLALLGDAGHMLTDSFALGLAIFALTIARIPPNSTKTFGYYRAEILAALFNGSLLIFICGYIFYQAYTRILNPPEIRSTIMLGVATLGLFANLAGILILRAPASQNLNMRGAFLHMLSDTLSSLGVIIGAILIGFTGLRVIDPLISIIIGILILRGAIGLIFDSSTILLEATPKHISLEDVSQGIKQVKGVEDLHHLHLWTIGSGMYALSGHLVINDQMVSESAKILEKVNEVLHSKFDIRHSTLQLECETCDGGICPLAGMHPS